MNKEMTLLDHIPEMLKIAAMFPKGSEIHQGLTQISREIKRAYDTAEVCRTQGFFIMNNVEFSVYKIEVFIDNLPCSEIKFKAQDFIETLLVDFWDKGSKMGLID